MKIRQYFEDEEWFKEIKKIKKDCRKYLNLLKDKPLYRSMEEGGGWNIFEKKKVRKGRLPKGTPKHWFNPLNKWLERNNHARRDNALIATSEISTAKFHCDIMINGTIKYIFPIGNFNYSWVKSNDFNEHKPSVGWNPDFIMLLLLPSEFKKYEINKLKDIMNEFEDVTKTKDIDKGLNEYITTNKGFQEAYNKGFEIWFSCNEYYYLDIECDLAKKMLEEM